MTRSSAATDVRFRPRARVIRALGDRLVSGPVAALLELVKNAYDADASNVTISLRAKASGPVTMVSVIDDGHGLSLADIHEKWMEPATESKVAKRISPGGRPMLGSKGIGRFAAARVGNRMTLRSSRKVAKSTESAQVTVDWESFEQGYLDEKVLHVRHYRDDGLSVGTSLEMTGLREEWAGTLLVKAVRELRRLATPLSRKTNKPFRILIDVSSLAVDHPASVQIRDSLPNLNPESFSNGAVEVEPFPVLAAADYEVDGKYDAKGNFTGQMIFNRSGQRTVENLAFSVPVDPQREEASCGPVSVRLLIIDRETDSLKALIRRLNRQNELTAEDLRKTLDETTGVAIYRDGFRIRPYGDNDQDWLTLDRRRVQDPSKHIGHNQVIGTLTVGDEAKSGLVEKSSREGLEENASYRRLVGLMRALLDREVEERRRNHRKRLGIGVRKPKTFSDARQAALLTKIEATASTLPKRQRERVQKDIAEASMKITAALRDIEERQARLEAGATLGLIVSQVLHEGRQPVTFIVSASKHAVKVWPRLFEDSDASSKSRVDVGSDLARIETEARRLERLFRLLNPISGRRRGRPSDYSVADVMGSTLALFRERIDSSGTAVVNDCVDGLSHGYRDDLAAALANLIDNSLFWLGHLKVRNPQIRITCTRTGPSIVLEVSDNGPGVAEDFHDRLFEPGFSTKPDGTGLGLSIAREALARSGAEISYVKSRSGSTFRITLPRSSH